jgi:phospholipid transport system substrate-binding protein
VAAALVVAALGPPTTPAEHLGPRIARAVAILADPALEGEEKAAERRAAVRTIARDIFDFEEMAKRALGLHWRARTPGEQSRFVELFVGLLEHAYFSRIERYGGGRVVVAGEAVDGRYATVHTLVISAGEPEIPIDYRMAQRDDRWLVYDVVIEGVSLVANYRSQFNRIIRQSSYEALIERMRAKMPDGVNAPRDERVGVP